MNDKLKGFQRVSLRPGRSAVVSFALDAHDLSYWNDAANGWVGGTTPEQATTNGRSRSCSRSPTTR